MQNYLIFFFEKVGNNIYFPRIYRACLPDNTGFIHSGVKPIPCFGVRTVVAINTFLANSIPTVMVQTVNHFWGHMLTWTHLLTHPPSSMTFILMLGLGRTVVEVHHILLCVLCCTSRLTIVYMVSSHSTICSKWKSRK